MTESAYRLDLTLDNYKSYYGDPANISIRKPLTVLAGPNGEGKSNLLEGMLIPAAEFLVKAQKFRSQSLFHRQVQVSTDPLVEVSYYDLIFQDHLLRSLYKAKTEVGPPQRLDPAAAVSEGSTSGRLDFRIFREKASYEKLMADFEVRFDRSEKVASDIKANEFDDFDLLYANSDSLLVDFLVHLFSDEMGRRWAGFPGAGQRADFVADVLGYFPNAKERLIQDVSQKGFLERFLSDTYRFLRANLATGAKKESLVYLIGLVLDRFRANRDNLLIVLLDEIESGINVLRQKLVVESLIHVLEEEFPEKKHQVKIILTTHSPVVYSELGQRTDVAEVFYILRDDNAPSHVYDVGGGATPQEVEKKILLELGLNVFDLPRRVVFVEGPTDAWFLREVFKDCHVTPLNGGSVPRILQELLASIRLAWDKRYTLLVDDDMLSSFEADIERIHKRHGERIRIEALTHECDSIEEFLLEVDISGQVNAPTLWSRLEERFQEVNTKLRRSGLKPFDYSIPEIRETQQGRGKEGVEDFLESLKTNERFYRVFGEHWRDLLSDSGREFIRKFRRTQQLSFKEQ